MTMAQPTVYIDIADWRVARDERGKEFIVYCIRIKLDKFAWTVYRRYSDFKALSDTLRKVIPDVPPAPPKRVFGSKNADFVEGRRQELMAWVQALARDERVCRVQDFHDFLRNEANTPPPGMLESPTHYQGSSLYGSASGGGGVSHSSSSQSLAGSYYDQQSQQQQQSSQQEVVMTVQQQQNGGGYGSGTYAGLTVQTAPMQIGAHHSTSAAAAAAAAYHQHAILMGAAASAANGGSSGGSSGGVTPTTELSSSAGSSQGRGIGGHFSSGNSSSIQLQFMGGGGSNGANTTIGSYGTLSSNGSSSGMSTAAPSPASVVAAVGAGGQLIYQHQQAGQGMIDASTGLPLSAGASSISSQGGQLAPGSPYGFQAALHHQQQQQMQQFQLQQQQQQGAHMAVDAFGSPIAAAGSPSSGQHQHQQQHAISPVALAALSAAGYPLPGNAQQLTGMAPSLLQQLAAQGGAAALSPVVMQQLAAAMQQQQADAAMLQQQMLLAHQQQAAANNGGGIGLGLEIRAPSPTSAAAAGGGGGSATAGGTQQTDLPTNFAALSPMARQHVTSTSSSAGSSTNSAGSGGEAGSGRITSKSARVGLKEFALLKVVGKGSFGKVMQVRKRDTGRIYAMKVLQKANIVKRNQVEHTRTERNVLGRIVHPFIVGLNYAFQTSDKLYFVLDYCAGGELFFHLGREGRFSEERSRFYAAQIVLALEHLHTLDVIYRDLKPENVLLDHSGNVRLTDFGLSKEGVRGPDSGAHSFCGTPEYLAPEVLNRTGHGRGVDWWSLGALLYEMLTGLPPFYCRDRAQLFERIRSGALELPSYLSPAAADILSGLLNRSPEKRLGCGPSDATEIKCHPFFAGVDWEGLLEGRVRPSWVPAVSSSLDTSQFDSEFTSMPLVSPSSHRADPALLQAAAAVPNTTFEGFTFVAPSELQQQHAGAGDGRGGRRKGGGNSSISSSAAAAAAAAAAQQQQAQALAQQQQQAAAAVLQLQQHQQAQAQAQQALAIAQWQAAQQQAQLRSLQGQSASAAAGSGSNPHIAFGAGPSTGISSAASAPGGVGFSGQGVSLQPFAPGGGQQQFHWGGAGSAAVAGVVAAVGQQQHGVIHHSSSGGALGGIGAMDVSYSGMHEHAAAEDDDDLGGIGHDGGEDGYFDEDGRPMTSHHGHHTGTGATLIDGSGVVAGAIGRGAVHPMERGSMDYAMHMAS